MQEKTKSKQPGVLDLLSPGLVYTSLHHPISLAIASNVPNFEKGNVFSLWQAGDDFIRNSVRYLIEAAKRSAEICKQINSSIYQQLEEKIRIAENHNKFFMK